MFLNDTAIPGHASEGRISTMPEPDGMLFMPTPSQRAAVKKPPKRTYQEYYDYFRNTMNYHHEHSDREAKRFVELQKFWGHGVHLNPDMAPGVTAQLPYCENVADPRPNHNCRKRPATDSEVMKKAGKFVAATALVATAGYMFGANAANAAAASGTAGTAAPVAASGKIASGAIVKGAAAGAKSVAAGSALAAKTATAAATKSAGIVASKAAATASGGLTAGKVATGAAAIGAASKAVGDAAGGIASTLPGMAQTANEVLNTAAIINAIRNGQLPPPPVSLTDDSLASYAGAVAQHYLRNQGVELSASDLRAVERDVMAQHELLRAAASSREPNPIQELLNAPNLALYAIGAVGLIAVMSMANKPRRRKRARK